MLIPLALLFNLVGLPGFQVQKHQSKPPVVSQRGNRNGRVFVVMYHHIKDGKNLMFRSATKFRADLNRMYKMGFRPVTVTDYVNNKMRVPSGKTPVVITFDDAHDDQFHILKDGSIDPKSAVGIWKAFAEEHPDFPVVGTWYVLPNLWGQEKLQRKKIDMLQGWGSEIGNHTVHHGDLKKMSDATVMNEIAQMNLKLRKLGVPANMPFCPPYGSFPKNKALMKSFSYKGQTISHSSACQAGWCPAYSPNDKKNFTKYSILRLHGNGRMYGIDWWLNEVEAGRCKVYKAP
jgi:peptidoglycan/xylan/chitin deacetylase (PgdA/CDA1 family)